jgi:DNA-cytosine methyltransferase
MNVLSLFDGMSCGQIALNRVGIKYDKYFASEIDKYAIQVTKENFPNTIHIGDVKEVKGEDLPNIDLLIGGSPCQGFSFAGKQLNFEDPRSKLFFEYTRLLKEVKPKYFLLENVVMKKEFQDIISDQLGVEPILINSSLVAAQNRKRLYWTNIPNVEQPRDKGILIKDIILNNADDTFFIKNRNINGKNSLNKLRLSERQLDEKFRCLTAGGQGATNAGATTIRLSDGDLRIPTPEECELAQTVPLGYTKSVSKTQRYKMLGNGWTVDVIAHIFKNIK